MIQDISPHKYFVEYKNCKAKDTDILMVFKDNKILVQKRDGRTWFPYVNELDIKGEIRFLFRVDDTNIFMTETDRNFQGWQYEDLWYFRTAYPMWKAFAGATAHQIHRWYGENKFCSRCGSINDYGKEERSLVCPNCGKVVYPSIAPCVIVALVDNDRILLTKYNKSHSTYRKYALIAGYTEVGETFEDTVKREVMEEVGLKVKNITYYKNQPWSFSDTILMGFFCQVDGSSEIKMDKNELSEATWLHRSEIPKYDSEISLTNEMIEVFRQGKERLIEN